jgi:hypothetical protein
VLYRISGYLQISPISYICIISRDYHLPKSLIITVSIPAFLSRQAKAASEDAMVAVNVTGYLLSQI